MLKELRDYAENLLTTGRIKAFLGLQQNGEHIQPFLFTQPEELADLSIGGDDPRHPFRYPLVKILNRLMRSRPTDTFGILVRGCDERAIHKLIRASQIDRNRLILVGFPCPAELADRHHCHKPYPDALAAGTVLPELTADKRPAFPVERNFIHDIAFIRDFCERCMKCYGCRNICPVCYCSECTLEENAFIPRGELPPANPNFLLTRAIHMVDFCIYCGLCEEACPADIPLTTLYKMVANLVDDQQDYVLQGFSLPRGGLCNAAAG